MNVVELWNTCVDWFPATTMVINSDDGDQLQTYKAIEDCLKFCCKNTLWRLSVGGLDETITIEVEV